MSPTPCRRLARVTGAICLWLLFKGLCAADPPPNDNFAQRTVLSGTAILLQGTNSEASSEPGDPEGLMYTVWYSWTAPGSGMAKVLVADFRAIARAAVFTGPDLSQLQFVAFTAGISSGWGQVGNLFVALFPVTEGVTYQIAVAAAGGQSGSEFTLGLVSGTPPPNDDFADRIPLGPGDAITSGLNTVATTEPGEPSSGSAPHPGTVWWSWTAATTGPVVVTVEGTPAPSYPWGSQQPIINVFTGDEVSTLTAVPGRLEWLRHFSPLGQATFDALAGMTYQIRVHGYFGLASGFSIRIAETVAPAVVLAVGKPRFREDEPVSLMAYASDPDGSVASVEFYTVPGVFSGADNVPHSNLVARIVTPPFRFETNWPPGLYSLRALATDNNGAKSLSPGIGLVVSPRNDKFADSIPLVGLPAEAQGTTMASTRDEEEPAGFKGLIWWNWTAPTSGVYSVIAEGYNHQVDVFTGSELSNLVPVASGDFEVPFEPINSRATLNAEAGKRYHIAVSGEVWEWFDEMTLVHLRIVPSIAPTITIVSPTNDTTFTLVETIPVLVDANDSDGTVRAVELFVGWDRVATVTNRPFDFAVAASNLHDFRTIRAAVTDNFGVRAFSDEVILTIIDPPPPNDSFTNRFVLAGSSLLVTGTTVGATSEPGQPHSWNSVWWEWTAPASGTYTLGDETNWNRPFLGVYTGSELSNLVVIATNELGNSGLLAPRVVFGANAGMNYVFCVGIHDFGADPFPISLLPTAPPTISLTSPTNRAEFARGGPITFLAEASDSDGVIRSVKFYVDSALVGTATNSPYAITTTLAYPYGSYRVWASATDDDGATTLTTNIYIATTYPPPANDDFSQRITLTGASLTFTASVAEATRETEEVGPSGAWWSWAAPAAGAYTITVTSPGHLVFVGAYQGSSLSDLTMIANDGFTYHEARVVINATAGTAYALAIASFNEVVVSIRPSAPPFVSLVSPTNGATVVSGETVSIRAEAADSDGAIRQVDFYVNSLWVGTATNAPFVVSYKPEVPFGTIVHSVRASATDDAGLITVSEGVSLRVRVAPPANDAFSAARLLKGAVVVELSTIEGATIEPGEPLYDLGQEQRSIWWKWTAPMSGSVSLFGIRAPQSGPFDVFAGSSLDDLILITNNAAVSEASILTFAAVGGREYRFRAGYLGGYSVQIALLLDALEVEELSRSTGEGFSTRWRGTLDRYWRIEASGDLNSWIAIQTNASLGGTLEFVDDESKRLLRRFYRLSPLP